MSFFKSLAHAFGFGNNDESEEYVAEDTVDGQYCVADLDSAGTQAKSSDGNSYDDIPDDLFDSVLEIFNNTQPDFIRECIDKDAQRRYLYGVLGTSFKSSIEKCKAQVEKEIGARAEAERDKLVAEIERLRGRLKSVEGHETQLNDARLSADRQKRALSDKISTLEQQVMTLEAEKEQYKLEINSLMNRIEATSGTGAQTGEGEDTSALRSRLFESESLVKHLQEEVERLNKEIDETAELYKSKMAMSDKMLSDIRNSNRNSSKELEDSKTLSENLQAKLNAATVEIERLNGELSEAKATLDTAEEVMEKIKKFESVLKKRDVRIKKLEEDNSGLESKIASLETENSSMAAEKAAIEAENKRLTEAVIASQRVGNEKASEKASPQVEKPRRKRKTVPKISAIDEAIDSTEWLVSTPPENTPKITPAVSDTEFGYQEPPKKSHPKNDAQMSLF